MSHRLLARRLLLASLDVAIRKARRELRWCRLILKLGAALRRDTTSMRIVLRRAERRLDLLLADRRRAAERAGGRATVAAARRPRPSRRRGPGPAPAPTAEGDSPAGP